MYIGTCSNVNLAVSSRTTYNAHVCVCVGAEHAGGDLVAETAYVGAGRCP